MLLTEDAYENKRALNGKTNGKVILLSMKQSQTFLSVTAWHEVFHWAKMQDKKTADALQSATYGLMEYVIETQGKDEYLAMFYERAPLTIEKRYFTDTMKTVDLKAENIREELKRMFGEEDFNAVEEEIAAEWYGTAKTIDLERFVSREVEKDPTLWEKIKNKLREIVDDIMTKLSKLAKGNKTMANALKVAEADRVFITDFTERVERELAKIAERSGTKANVRVSEKDARTEKYSYALNKSLFEQLKDWLSSFGKGTNIYNGQFFKLGDTPDILVKHGAKKLDLIMLPDVVIKTTGGKHSIAIDEIAKLPSELRDPIMLFKGSQPNSFVALTELKDKNGNDVIVAVHLNNKINRTVINRIASLYSKSDNFGNNHIENYVKQQIEQGNLLDASIKKHPNGLRAKGSNCPNWFKPY